MLRDLFAPISPSKASNMQEIKIAVIGPPHSGKSALAAQLSRRTLKRAADPSPLLLLATNCGVQASPQLWLNFDFVVATFDLTVYNDDEAGCDFARRMLCGAIRQRDDFARTCLVGTKFDLLPQTALDVAVSVGERARRFSVDTPTLRLFPVSSVAGTGYTELILYIANAVYPCGEHVSCKTRLYGYLGNFGTWVIDRVAELLALPVPDNVNQSTPPDPQDLDESTINTLIQSPETRAWDEALMKFATSWGGSTSHKITSDLIVKRLDPVEYATMCYIRSHTGIPVPQPRYPHLKKWLVMDFIDGRMLLECWDSLSWWMQLRIACTLRGYVRQLRRLKSARPGSIIDRTIKDHTLFDDQPCGPFVSSTQFRLWSEYIAHGGWLRWVRYRRNINLPVAEDPPYPVMGGEWPLVFTHGDLNLGNILLSRDGVLWIIDWASGGFFPPWLESIGINYAQPPPSFARYRRFIAGVSRLPDIQASPRNRRRVHVHVPRVSAGSISVCTDSAVHLEVPNNVPECAEDHRKAVEFFKICVRDPARKVGFLVHGYGDDMPQTDAERADPLNWKLQYTHELFEPKVSKDVYGDDEAPEEGSQICTGTNASTQCFTIDNWPTSSNDARTALEQIKSTHVVRPLPLFNHNDVLLPPTDYETAMRGSVVAIYFTLCHYAIPSNNYDNFLALVDTVRIVNYGGRTPMRPIPKRRLGQHNRHARPKIPKTEQDDLVQRLTLYTA
ncbi:hypothetical protein NM688_g2672 [Phlebia brevispora]|uniref:Uncharacterized protein n=1 Tax=Phlebia brevispora TaxID=194682 RepID=A0ACC1T826_9APHY|nr:hypothetical protein NM688_g2672 [Phlebia brevispora]